MKDLYRILVVYSWGGVGLLLLLFYRIARFYQRTSGERSCYRWFLLPGGLFGLAAIRYAWVADFAGDPMGDSLLALAGGSSLLLGYFLLNLMMGDRQ